MQLRAESLASTHAIAAALAGLARPGDVIVLAGDMGAGKTAFAQGFGRALGIEEAITSPTFTLVHSYPIPGSKHTLHHADLYRLDTTSDVEDLALHELAEFGGIVLVEWGDVVSASFDDHLEVRLERDEDDDDDDDEDDDEDDVSEPDEGAGAGDDMASPADSSLDDDFGLDEARLLTLEATGKGWAGRWDRVVAAMEPYRC